MAWARVFFLVAVGAILHFAVTATLAGIDIQVGRDDPDVIGVIASRSRSGSYLRPTATRPSPPPSRPTAEHG